MWEKPGGMVVVEGQVMSKVSDEDNVGNGTFPFE